MVQTAGFDPSAVPAGPSEGRRQPEREPDSARITPVDEGEQLRADRRRADAEEAASVEPPPRVAFTAKFGPAADGFPLQIVRGADVVAAETIDFEVIASRRISRADREVLLRAQEEQAVAEETARQDAAVEASERRDETVDVAVRAEETEAREQENTDTDTDTDTEPAQRVDVEV